ncbi:hypothetical protein LJR300_002812 [Caulobacter sp. LjRoot300]
MIDQVAQRLTTGKVAVRQYRVALVLQGGDQGQEVARRNLKVVEQIRPAQAIHLQTDGSGRKVEQGLFRDRVANLGHGDVLLFQRRRAEATTSTVQAETTICWIGAR